MNDIKRSKFPTLLLLFFNLVLFSKLKFFIPELTGNVQILDFETYFKLVNDMITGINPYTVSYMQTLGPPSVFAYFIPFSLLKFQTAKFLYTFINISAGFAMCYLLSRKLFKRNVVNWFLFLNLLLFSSFPARFSIEVGQPNLVIGYLVSLLICSNKDRFWTSPSASSGQSQNDSYNKFLSTILGLIIIIKTNYLIALMPYIRKNLRLVTKTLLTILCVLVFLSPVILPSYYSYYFTHKNENFIPQMHRVYFPNYYNQSITSRLSVMGFSQLTPTIYILVVIATLFLVYKSQNILLGILASVILSPISWQHYFAALFPIYVLCIIKIRGITSKIVSIFAFLLFWVEFPFLHSANINILTAIISSHYLASAITFFVLIKKNKITSLPASE